MRLRGKVAVAENGRKGRKISAAVVVKKMK